MAMNKYYKYLNLTQSKTQRIIDIIINKHLYAASHRQLNDPMEGYYLSRENLPQNLRNEIRNQKSDYRICSFSQDDSKKLMWAHYANGFRGIVIGFTTKERVHSVQYNGLLEINILQYNNYQDLTPVFLNKMEEWAYEEESRVVLNNSGEYIDIEPIEIIFGLRVDESLKGLLIDRIRELKPNMIFKQQNPDFQNIEIANQIL